MFSGSIFKVDINIGIKFEVKQTIKYTTKPIIDALY